MLIEVALPVPADEAWAHLREPALVRRWFGWDYDGLEREIEIVFDEEAVADDEARTITWETGDRFVLDGSTLRVFHEPPAGASTTSARAGSPSSSSCASRSLATPARSARRTTSPPTSRSP